MIRLLLLATNEEIWVQIGEVRKFKKVGSNIVLVYVDLTEEILIYSDFTEMNLSIIN